MQKVSKDKQIEETVREELKSSMKRALEDLKLPAREEKVAEKLTNESISPKIKQIARAEVFKEEYPQFIGREGTVEEKQLYRRIVRSVKEAEKELKSSLGDRFVGISFVGSWQKRYAGKESDVDLHVLGKNISEDELRKKAEPVLEKALSKIGKDASGAMYYPLDATLESIRKVKQEVEWIPSILSQSSFKAAQKVYFFFNEETFGEGIHEARKEIIGELVKSPHGEKIWEDVRIFHEAHTRGVIPMAFEFGKYVFSPDDMKKLGVSLENIEEIFRAREEFALPPFEEIKKRYGVT
jgi:predicted nucleotidyltransferase